MQRAIDQLGYRPNTAARALVRGRSGMVGIVTACLGAPVFLWILLRPGQGPQL